MSQPAALMQMANLVYDARAAALQQATARRTALEAQLRALDAQPLVESGLALAAEARASLDYDRWASRRRAEINAQLARQRAECLILTVEVRRAFGRCQALDRLSAVLPGDFGDQDVGHDVAQDPDRLFL